MHAEATAIEITDTTEPEPSLVDEGITSGPTGNFHSDVPERADESMLSSPLADDIPPVAGEAEMAALRLLLTDEAWGQVVSEARVAMRAKRPPRDGSGKTRTPIPRREDAPALAEYRRRHSDLSAQENKAKAIRRTDEFWEIVVSLGGRDMRQRHDPKVDSAWDTFLQAIESSDDLATIMRLGQQMERQFPRLRMETVRKRVVAAAIQAGGDKLDADSLGAIAKPLMAKCRSFLLTKDLVASLRKRLRDDYDDYLAFDDSRYGDYYDENPYGRATMPTPVCVNDIRRLVAWPFDARDGLLAREVLGVSPWDYGTKLDAVSKSVRRAYMHSEIGKATQALSLAWGTGQITDQPALVDIARDGRDDVLHMVACELDGDTIIELVSKNPHYKAMFEAEAKMEEGILDKIPSNPIDLYPLARSMSRHFVLHVGPTNSGKTHDAIDALGRASSGAYLAPLRLLAYEQYERLNDQGCPCSLLTGEEDVPVSGAHHVSSTVEMLDFSSPVDVAVIDEAQMMSDSDRGSHWTAAILGVPASEVHVCMAPEAESLVKRLVKACEDDYETVRHQRMTELTHEEGSFAFPKDVRKGDALVVFSRRAVHAVAAAVAASGRQTSMIYGALPYDVRHREAERFASGETDIVVATDAIGMGMNLPIRRIVFLEQAKFDGHEKRFLSASEVRQIAGRAGRYGLHESGIWKSANATRQMIRLMEAKIPQMREAPLGFEKTLLGVDGTVSQLMTKWTSMGVPEPFTKHDLEREQELARELEGIVGTERATDLDCKRLVYAFATLPFKEQVMGLHSTWLTMFRAELDGGKFDVKVPSGDLPSSMDALEEQYAYADLLHQYCRAFSYTEHYDEIAERRRLISDRISEMIAGSTFEARKCRECGRPLPWNWPYPMCDPCHESRYSWRRYDW